MKRFVLILAALLLLVPAFADGPVANPASDAMADIIAAASQQSWLQVGAEAAMTQIDAIDPVVIDVRTQTEWDDLGHIPGAILIPVTELNVHLDMLPTDLDTPIIVYCARGTRGNYALLFLKALGYGNVKNLSGGFGAWVAADLPVEN